MLYWKLIFLPRQGLYDVSNSVVRRTLKFNSIQSNSLLFMCRQQLQDQLQTQHSVDTGNYIMDKHNIKLKSN
jgi:hypothetical protein